MTVADPFAPELQQEPWEALAHIRQTRPVYPDPARGFTIISGYPECEQALSDTANFSSRAYQAVQGPGMTSRLPAYFHEQLARRKPSVDALAVLETSFLFGLDGEDHRRLRNLVATAFIPQRVRNLHAIVDETIDALVRPMREGVDEIEIVMQLANPLPCRVIAEILGIGLDHTEDFRRWAICITQNPSLGLTPPTEAHLDLYLDSAIELFTFLTGKIAEARLAPRDDFLSTLVTARDDQGVALTDQEIIAFLQALLVGGQETTTAIIASGVKILLEQPHLLDALLADPGRIDDFVDEVLRHDSPSSVFRMAAIDCELGGTTIPAGTPLLLLLKAANRDERKFAEPDRFILGREGNDHLSFGKGIHFCPGFRLARHEAQAMFAAIVPLLGDYRIADARWSDGFDNRKLERLVLRHR